MPGRRPRPPRERELKLRRLQLDEQARVLAKLVRLQEALAVTEPMAPEHQADLDLVHDELLWVQRESFLRRASIPRLAELFEQHGIK